MSMRCQNKWPGILATQRITYWHDYVNLYNNFYFLVTIRSISGYLKGKAEILLNKYLQACFKINDHFFDFCFDFLILHLILFLALISISYQSRIKNHKLSLILSTLIQNKSSLYFHKTILHRKFLTL